MPLRLVPVVLSFPSQLDSYLQSARPQGDLGKASTAPPSVPCYLSLNITRETLDALQSVAVAACYQEMSAKGR